MKFRAEILAVETAGLTLRVKTQASGIRDANWRDMEVFTFSVPATDAQCAAFHVGRMLDIEVKPR